MAALLLATAFQGEELMRYWKNLKVNHGNGDLGRRPLMMRFVRLVITSLIKVLRSAPAGSYKEPAHGYAQVSNLRTTHGVRSNVSSLLRSSYEASISGHCTL